MFKFKQHGDMRSLADADQKMRTTILIVYTSVALLFALPFVPSANLQAVFDDLDEKILDVIFLNEICRESHWTMCLVEVGEPVSYIKSINFG